MDGPSTPAEGRSAEPATNADPDQLRARLERLRAAYEKRGERMAAERVRFADLLSESELRGSDLERQVARLEEERDGLRAEVVGKDGELRRLMNTRTFRWTAGIRRLWGRLRGGPRT